MWRHNYNLRMKTAIKITAWCMCLLCSLSGCSGEDTATRQATNKQEVPVTINLNQAAWGTEQSAQYTKAPSQEVSIPVKGGVLTATLEPAAPAQTRSTEINYGVRYRLIAYKENDVSFTGYVNHADFVKGGVAPTFWLQTDRTYTLVCYSFNSAEAMPEFNKWLNVLFDVSSEYDFMYGKKNVTITAENRSIDMEMQHLFSQVTVIADASADASGYTISACSGTVSPSYAADVNLTDGSRTKRHNTVSKAVNWTDFGAITATSAPTLIYYDQTAYNDPPLTVTLNSITIDGTTLTNCPFTFSGIMQAACNYTLRIKFYAQHTDNGVTWAPGNLIYTNNTYSFATTQEFYSNAWDGGDYWNWRVLNPADNSNCGSEYDTPLVDPCTKVLPAGTWRMPKKEEFETLIKSGYVKAYKNGVLGMYFGTTTAPAAGSEKNYVFLPAAGKRQSKGTTIDLSEILGMYWCATPYSDSGAYYLEIATSFSKAQVSCIARTEGYTVRCVK